VDESHRVQLLGREDFPWNRQNTGTLIVRNSARLHQMTLETAIDPETQDSLSVRGFRR